VANSADSDSERDGEDEGKPWRDAQLGEDGNTFPHHRHYLTHEQKHELKKEHTRDTKTKSPMATKMKEQRERKATAYATMERHEAYSVNAHSL
jgi:hypothetical protein